MRHELRAQLGNCIADYDKTGEGGKNRPAWLKNVAQLALVTTQQLWSKESDKARKLGSGGDRGTQSYYNSQLDAGRDDQDGAGRAAQAARRSAMNVITLEAHSPTSRRG